MEKDWLWRILYTAVCMYLSRHFILVVIICANQSESKFLFLPLNSCQNVSLGNQSFNLPTIETCFNCFGTRSSDSKKNKKTTKPPRKFISYATILSPPLLWRERGSLQDGASAWRRNFFAHHTRPVGKKLYSLLIVSIWNNLKRYTTGYRSGPIQQVRSGT